MTNKSNFGTGKLVNVDCQVVRGTSQLEVTFPPDSLIRNNIGRLGYVFSYGLPAPLSSKYIWLGDFGTTIKFVPTSVSLEERSGNEFVYIRTTPYEREFTKRGVPTITIKKIIDSIDVRRSNETVIISPTGQPYFTTDLTRTWGPNHAVTAIPGGNNYCSRELVPDDGNFSPPFFKGKPSKDDPDGQIQDNPEDPNNRSITPKTGGFDDDEDEEENRVKLQFLKISISRFRIEPDGTYNKNSSVAAFQKFSNVEYGYATGSHEYVLIPIENTIPELFYRHGLSFLSVLFFDTIRVVFVGKAKINFRYGSCIAVIEQLGDFDNKIKESLAKSIQVTTKKYFLSRKKEIGLNEETPELKYIHPSDESKKPTTKIWSYSYYENIEKVARDI